MKEIPMRLESLEPLKKIQQKDVDQKNGWYYVNDFKPCCFGAHYAKVHGIEPIEISGWQNEGTTIGKKALKYSHGRSKFMDQTGLSLNETIVLFYLAGLREKNETYKAIDPFSDNDWNYDLRDMIQRLESIKYDQIHKVMSDFDDYLDENSGEITVEESELTFYLTNAYLP